MDMNKKALKISSSARDAGKALAQAGESVKNLCLERAAEMLVKRGKGIISSNKKDLAAGKKAGLSAAMLDRLEINSKGLSQMAEGLLQVASLPDPVGRTISGWRRPNGLNIRKVRIPIGVIFMIFESRPNVTVDAGSLALKSGNAVILRGGKEAIHSNIALGKVMADALKSVGLPKDCVQVIDTPDRSLANALLKQESNIDVVIPRGGKGLIKTVMEESVIPVIAHLDGICHVFIDKEADLDMAVNISLNAKTQRTGVCNAMETLLVHEGIAKKFIPLCFKGMKKKKVKLIGCNKTVNIARGIKVENATEEDWATEYLDSVLSVKVVKDVAAAVKHINKYGSNHTDAIVTQDVETAEYFRRCVDSSSVMVNASTRFSDGFEYGFGAEMGISTNKLHARGPVGLEELTTYKFLVDGNGQIRE